MHSFQSIPESELQTLTGGEFGFIEIPLPGPCFPPPKTVPTGTGPYAPYDITEVV